MATYTITINERNAGGKKFLEFIKTLDFVKIKNNTQKKCGLEDSISDIKAGRVTSYKSSNDLFKKLGI